MFTMNKKSFIAIAICTIVFISQSFTDEKKDEHKPTNLTVLPKDISDEELHKVMKEYSKSLGVRCGFCHEKKEEEQHSMDFASDTKHEKLVTRQMMEMVTSINENYLNKMGKGHFEKIGCVTCHMGKTTPIISIDSLPIRIVSKRDSLKSITIEEKDKH
jgi:hypothetical protein